MTFVRLIEFMTGAMAILFIFWTARALMRGEIWVANRAGGGWMVTRRHNRVGFWLWMLVYFAATGLAIFGLIMMLLTDNR
jgi:hypothetical protein